METHTFEDLILKTGLYESVLIDNDTNLELLTFLLNNDRTNIDMYCIHCEKESTFQLINKGTTMRDTSPFYQIGVNINVKEVIYSNFGERWGNPLIFSCSRNSQHSYAFILKIFGNRIVKIGQNPSMADIEKHDVEKYKKLLQKDYANLNKAIGLRSHGIGAGSYVYLRRIFENLIEEKHQEAIEETNWDETKYLESRMKEKIKLLKHKLPALLGDTPELYGILSKGIHELSEEECLNYFPVTKSAIEMILDEKIILMEKESKLKQLKTNLSQIAASVLK